MASRQCNSARSPGLTEASSVAVGTRFEGPDDIRARGNLHRHGVLGESHDAKLSAARHALEALAVVERQDVRHAVARDGMAGAARERHLHQRAVIALHEDIRKRAVGVDVLRVHHRVATAKAAELAGRDGCELPRPQRFTAQAYGACRGSRSGA